MSEPQALPPGVTPDAASLPWLHPIAPPPAGRRAAFHALVCEFNLRPDRYLHVTRVPAEWPARYRSPDAFGPAGRKLLARHLLDANGVAAHHDFDVANPCALSQSLRSIAAGSPGRHPVSATHSARLRMSGSIASNSARRCGKKFVRSEKKSCGAVPKILFPRLPNFARACGRVSVGRYPDKRPDSRQGKEARASLSRDATLEGSFLLATVIGSRRRTGVLRSQRGTRLKATTERAFLVSTGSPPAGAGY